MEDEPIVAVGLLTQTNVTRLFCARLRARLVGTAGPVHFPRSDAREADARPFGTPNGTVAIPDMSWRAGECFAGRDDQGRCE